MITRVSTVTTEEFLRAATYYNVALVNRYIEENRDNPAALNVQNGADCSALLLAINCLGGDQAKVAEGRTIVNALLAAGVDPNNSNTSKTSPLLAAVCCGNHELLADLLAVKGLDLNPKAYGDTPLSRSAKFGATLMVKMLLEAGAFIEDLQQFLDTHQDENKFGEIVALLKQKNENNKRTYFISQLKLDECDITQPDVKLLMSISNNKFLWLREISANLKASNQLNSTSFSMALHGVAYKSPAASEPHNQSDDTGATPLNLMSHYTVQASHRQRLQWLVSSLTQLNALHSQFLFHGNLSTDSFGLNIQTGQLQLIDCGDIHKVRAFNKRSRSTLLQYCMFNGNRYEGTESFTQDVFMFGQVIADRIYPELFGYFTAHSNTEKNPAIEAAIIKLVTAMTEPSAASRCTTEQALALCKLLRDHADHLTEDMLDQFLQSTINRRDMTAEDVLRESMRPTRLSK